MAGGEGNRELLLKGYGVSVFQDEKGSGDSLQESVNILTTTDLYVWKLLR